MVRCHFKKCAATCKAKDRRRHRRLHMLRGGIALYTVPGVYTYKVPGCAEFNDGFGRSRPNFKPLELGHIEVDSADFWTNRSLSSTCRSTTESLASKSSHTLTLQSGRRFDVGPGRARARGDGVRGRQGRRRAAAALGRRPQVVPAGLRRRRGRAPGHPRGNGGTPAVVCPPGGPPGELGAPARRPAQSSASHAFAPACLSLLFACVVGPAFWSSRRLRGGQRPPAAPPAAAGGAGPPFHRLSRLHSFGSVGITDLGLSRYFVCFWDFCTFSGKIGFG